MQRGSDDFPIVKTQPFSADFLVSLMPLAGHKNSIARFCYRNSSTNGLFTILDNQRISAPPADTICYGF